MDMNKRLRLAKALANRGKASSKGADASTQPAPEPTPPTSPTSYSQNLPNIAPNQDLPSPNATHTPSSPPSIVIVPLTIVETATTPAPLDKGKGVVVVPSEDDEDTEDGQVFMRRRTTKVVTSTSSSNHGAESLRDHPPSATSPPINWLWSVGLSMSPRLPPRRPQSFPQSYLHRATLGGPSEEAKKESMAYYLGAFLACANSWRDQARAKASELSTLQSLEKELASLKEQKQIQECRWVHQEDAYKDSLKEAQKAKDVANKRLHEAGQTYAELLGQVVPLRVEIAELKDVAKASKVKMKKLEDHCVDREVKLGETEAAHDAKTKAFDLLEAELAKLRAERDEALAAKAARDKELASQAERFEKTEKELIDDVASAFADGFAKALAQAACANPGIDTSSCGPLNHIIEGQVIPLEISED